METTFDLQDVINTILTGYGWEPERSAEIKELLQKNANSSAATVEELAEALRYQVPRCAMLRFSPEDVLAEIATLFNVGVSADLVNYTMRELLDKIARNLSNAVRLGIDIQELGLRELMVNLRKDFKETPENERANVVGKAFCRDLVNQFLVLLSHDETNEVEEG